MSDVSDSVDATLELYQAIVALTRSAATEVPQPEQAKVASMALHMALLTLNYSLLRARFGRIPTKRELLDLTQKESRVWEGASTMLLAVIDEMEERKP